VAKHYDTTNDLDASASHPRGIFQFFIEIGISRAELRRSPERVFVRNISFWAACCIKQNARLSME